MNTKLTLIKALPVALAVTMVSPVWADGEAKTGPAKAAKQSML